ncbi:MAG: hypothetical protein EZS28_039158, partial [Streblomastix strix]
MKELRMAVTAVHITYDGIECVSSRFDDYMLTRTNYQDYKLLRKQLHEEQLADKEQFDIVMDSTEMKFAFVGDD